MQRQATRTLGDGDVGATIDDHARFRSILRSLSFTVPLLSVDRCFPMSIFVYSPFLSLAE